MTVNRSYWACWSGGKGSDLFHRLGRTILEIVKSIRVMIGSIILIVSSRIANVLLQSGSPVADWIHKLPKPSRLKKKQMGKIQRTEIVNPARKIGRRDAIKKR